MYVIKRARTRLHDQVVDGLPVIDLRISRLTSDQGQRLNGQYGEPESLEKNSSIAFNEDVIDHGHLHPPAPFRGGCSFSKSSIVRKYLPFGHFISPFCPRSRIEPAPARRHQLRSVPTPTLRRP